MCKLYLKYTRKVNSSAGEVCFALKAELCYNIRLKDVVFLDVVCLNDRIKKETLYGEKRE